MLIGPLPFTHDLRKLSADMFWVLCAHTTLYQHHKWHYELSCCFFPLHVYRS